MAKYLLFLLCVALLSPACQKEAGPAPGGPTVVVHWHFGGTPGQKSWLGAAVEEFNVTHKDIQVELHFKDWFTQRESLISTTIMGEGPDLLHILHRYSAEFGGLGGLHALDNFPDFPQVKERFFPNVMELVAFDGKHYGIPMTMLPFVLAVNKKILADHGLKTPSTWEEMKALGPVLKEHGIHAFTMPGGPKGDTSYRFFPLLCKAGGRVLNEDQTQAAFNGPAGVAALSFLVDMQQQGFLPAASAAYLWDENLAHWCTEKAATSIEGPWWQDVIRTQYDFDLSKMELAPVPGPSQLFEGHPPRTLLDVPMVSITGYSKAKEEAWIVLKALFADHPGLLELDPIMTGLPTQKAAYEGEIESDFIDLDVLLSEAQLGLGWSGHPRIAEIQIILAIAVNTAFTGTMGPQEALDAAAEEVNEILNDF